jgi:GNAT superfamily N-acetyltransferase
MQIIQYNKKYLIEVLLLHKTAMEPVGAYKGDGPWENDLQNIEKHYLENNGTFILVLEQNKLIGMGAFRKIDEKTAEIKRMRVEPKMQGKGIGKYLLNQLEERARSQGYSVLILETSDRQERANAFYSKSGFKVMKYENIDGFNCAWYKKTLYE